MAGQHFRPEFVPELLEGQRFRGSRHRSTAEFEVLRGEGLPKDRRRIIESFAAEVEHAGHIEEAVDGAFAASIFDRYACPTQTVGTFLSLVAQA